MKNTEFDFLISFDKLVKEKENYINSLDGNPSQKVISSQLNKFIKFIKIYSKPIEAFTKEDFEKFFQKSCGSTSIFYQVKTRLNYFFKYAGYNDAAKELKGVKKIIKMCYIKSFSDLDEEIEKVRMEKYPFLKNVSDQPKSCDLFTVEQIIIYMAWIGIPQKVIFELSLDAIDLDNKVILTKNKDYSFAEYGKVLEVLSKYKNASTYINVMMLNGKYVTTVNEYRGSNLLRTRSFGSAAECSSKSIMDRALTHFKFTEGSYLNILRSGQFSRAYEKYKSGESPNFESSENIKDYFGIDISSNKSSIQTFKHDWNIYVNWRKETD